MLYAVNLPGFLRAATNRRSTLPSTVATTGLVKPAVTDDFLTSNPVTIYSTEPYLGSITIIGKREV